MRGHRLEFEITIVQPDNYIHSLAFVEVMESLAYGLDALGHGVRLTKNHVAATCPTIILGTNLLQPEHIAALPSQAIIYNLEQIIPGSAWATPAWLKSVEGHLIWEYSEKNMSYWKDRGARAIHVPIGYAPNLTRIERTVDRDIDVVFYGSMNNRRSRILDDLKSRNFRCAPLHGVYGAQRDRIIARSKLAINIHYYVPNIFEVVRGSYLVANSVPLLSERNADTYVPREWDSLAYWAPYDHLVAVCEELLNGGINALNRKAIERFDSFRQASMADLLTRVIAEMQP